MTQPRLVSSTFGLTVLLVAAILAPSTRADTVYPNLAAWSAATTGATSVTFGGIASPGSFVGYGLAGSTTIGGVTFSSNATSSLFVIDAGFGGGGYSVLGSPASINAQTISPALDVTFSSPMTSVAFDVMNAPGSPGTPNIIISLSNGDSFVIGPGAQFWGITTATAFNQLSITSATSPGSPTLGELWFGSAQNSNAVPEPSSVLLLISGLAPIIALRRRSRR